MWDVIFYSETCKEATRVGVWVRPPKGRGLNYSYNISFECRKNEAEYEAMVLAIHILKYFQVIRIMIHGYSKMVIKQTIGEY